MSDEFTVHKLNADGLEKATDIATIFATALHQLQERVPAGRDLAIVVTKLQEACLFAKHAIAAVPGNQE